MSILRNILGIIFTFSLMIILLISSVEVVAYYIPGYYRYEYTKYSSNEKVGMNMDELLRISNEMMDYLRGKREKLSDISATIKGRPDVLFFNEKEAAHMKDVRNLFIAAIYLRRILLISCILILTVIKLSGGSLKKILPRSLLIGSGIFFALFYFNILQRNSTFGLLYTVYGYAARMQLSYGFSSICKVKPVYTIFSS